MVPFGPCESAMDNSTLPDTEAAAEQYRKISEGPPLFYDPDACGSGFKLPRRPARARRSPRTLEAVSCMVRK
jgi:hypothetical protein